MQGPLGTDKKVKGRTSLNMKETAQTEANSCR